jgi:hypothetical protein
LTVWTIWLVVAAWRDRILPWPVRLVMAVATAIQAAVVAGAWWSVWR